MEKNNGKRKIETNINPNNFNRISIAIMEKNKCSYDEALMKLGSLKLLIECNDKINTSFSLQAALLTAINTAKRAFLGGVFVKLKTNGRLLIDWPNLKTLQEAILYFGGIIINEELEYDFKILIGIKPTSENELQIVCNGWAGGFIVQTDCLVFENNVNFEIPICGVMAASLGVGQAFLKVTGIDIFATESSILLSLWRPDLHWNDLNANGPDLKYLPKRFWLLGLGHLGQAYLWNISFLPYKVKSKVTFLLQDFDKVVDANFSAGLLCENNSIGKYKTRVCSEWLEKLGYSTIICERKFNENTTRINEEPYIALSGFDNLEARKNLLKSNFDFIIDCGLGGTLDNFDEIAINSFSNSDNSVDNIWEILDPVEINNKNVFNEFYTEAKCGVLATDLSSKAISTSFVGAFAGSFVVSEILKGLNEGYKVEKLLISIRDSKNKYIKSTSLYKSELSRNGYVSELFRRKIDK